MNSEVYKKMNEALTSFNFEDDDISFSKSNNVEKHIDLISNFIYKRIIGTDDSKLDDVEKRVLNAWKHDNSHNNIVVVNSLQELKDILEKSYKYLGNDGNYNWIDTSNVTSLLELFGHNELFEKFNGDITNWNISNVTNMSYTFTGCYNFNRDLSKWDFSNVKYMSGCFSGCNNEFKNQVKEFIDFSHVKTKFGIF